MLGIPLIIWEICQFKEEREIDWKINIKIDKLIDRQKDRYIDR